MNDYFSHKDGKETPSPLGRDGVGIKVCGMHKNTSEVAALNPDYLGFIFWEPSKRYFNGAIPELPLSIKKVGVFVDASIEKITEIVERYDLSLVQLHGQETPAFCNELKKAIPYIRIIKVFSIAANFDFSALNPFEAVCDFYLFDTKGKLPGGNGYAFNWEELKRYPSTKPYFLSGGIGFEDIATISEFMKRPEARYCQVIDVNSKFEVEPGLKNVEKLKAFKNKLVFPLGRRN